MYIPLPGGNSADNPLLAKRLFHGYIRLMEEYLVRIVLEVQTPYSRTLRCHFSIRKSVAFIYHMFSKLSDETIMTNKCLFV